MAKNYTITFKSLRAGTVYTLNINGGTGTAVPLNPGAQPFTTQEDSDEDIFTPVRTQSGYLRIVDDGKDANGNAFDWKDLIPATDTSRPVTLVDGGGNLMWQGFMQAQNFGGVLYGNPQEREFPVQCPISAINALKVTTDANEIHNFAYIIYNFMVTTMPSGAQFLEFKIQGGYDAQAWLLKKVDWQTFLRETENNDLEPAYTHLEVLEDVCRFWGWTLRTKQRTVYLTCMDDSEEQTMLTLTAAQLATMAGGTTDGTVSTSIGTVSLSGDIFASTNNESYLNRGPNKATVKSSINEHNTILEVFPPSVENQLKSGGWTWVQGDDDRVGYFETVQIGDFQTELMQGYTNGTYGAFSCRQIYSQTDTDDSTENDMILINHLYDGTYSAAVQTRKPMSFSGGSFKISGMVYFGDQICDFDEGARLKMRLGIGMTRQTAQWWYMNDVNLQPAFFRLDYGWSATLKEFGAPVTGGNIKSTGCRNNMLIGRIHFSYDAIPAPANQNLYGCVFIDILGLQDDSNNYRQSFQISDFKVEFVRDIIELPRYNGQVRARVKNEKRITSKEYVAENNNSARDEWNADCIFASDNNFKYGFGLIMNSDCSFMKTTQYGGSQANQQHPEQHLANRVASYWSHSRKRLSVELQKNTITEPTPAIKVNMDGGTWHAIAIGHEWRDDIVTLTLLDI